MATALQSSIDPASTCPFTLAADRWSSADLPIIRIRGTEPIPTPIAKPTATLTTTSTTKVEFTHD